MSNLSLEIHDKIQSFQLSLAPPALADEMLTILDLMNRRMDEIEARQKRMGSVVENLVEDIEQK